MGYKVRISDRIGVVGIMVSNRLKVVRVWVIVRVRGVDRVMFEELV